MTWHNNLCIKQEYYSLHSLSPVSQNKLSSFKVLGLRQIDETFGLANIGWEVHEDHGWPRKSFRDIEFFFSNILLPEWLPPTAGNAALRPLVALLGHVRDAVEAERSSLAELGEQGELEEVGGPERLAVAGQPAGLQQVGAVCDVPRLVRRGHEHLCLGLVRGESSVRLHFDLSHKVKVVFTNDSDCVADKDKHPLVLVHRLPKERPRAVGLEVLVHLDQVAGLGEHGPQGLEQLGNGDLWIFDVAKAEDDQLGGVPVQPVSHLVQQVVDRTEALVET